MTDTENVVSVSMLENIISDGLLATFDKVDLATFSRMPEYGEKTLGALFCQQSSVGMKIMESTVLANTNFLSREIAASVKSLRKEKLFGRMLAAGCGNLQRSAPDYSILSGNFDSDEGRSYLTKLINLGKLLE